MGSIATNDINDGGAHSRRGYQVEAINAHEASVEDRGPAPGVLSNPITVVATLLGKRFPDPFGTPAPDETAAVEKGCREARRVARLGIIVKVQDYMHASRRVLMTDWVRHALAPAELYDMVHLKQAGKITDPKWGEQLSARTNNSTFLVFRMD